MSIRLSIRQCLILGSMVAGLQILPAAQNPPSSSPPTQSPGSDDAGTRTAPAAPLSGIVGIETEGGAEDTSSDLPQIPALLGGKGASTAFVPKQERSNYLRGGINVTATYDDNALLASTGATSNTSVAIFPNFSIEQTTSRIRYTLGYAGGLTINENLGIGNQQAQNLNFDSQFRLSPHVNLRIAEVFSYTTGFFDAGTGTQIGGGSGGPNPSLITPVSTERFNTTTVETNYHFAKNDLIGGSGSFYALHFSNVPEGTDLTDSQTASGSMFLLHRLFQGDWGGVAYRFDRITFDPGGGETLVHSFTLVDTLSLENHFTLSGFIGPQYSVNQGLLPGTSQPTQSTDWSVAGGVEGGWRNLRTGVTAGYSRSVSDGGGVLGAVQLQNIHANFRRELVPGWAVALNFSHGTNQSVTVPFATSASSINLTSAGIALEHNVQNSIGLRVGYTHNFQEQFGLPAPNPTMGAHQNLFYVTISYQWAKPLGM